MKAGAGLAYEDTPPGPSPTRQGTVRFTGTPPRHGLLGVQGFSDRMTAVDYDNRHNDTEQFRAVSVGAGWVAGAVVQRGSDRRFLPAR